MKLNLTEAQAQAVIDSQAAEIKALRKRMTQAHVTLKYWTEMGTKVLSEQDIERTVNHLLGLIEGNDGVDRDCESWVDEEALEELIKRYNDLKAHKDWFKHGNNGGYIRVPLMSYLYQFAHNGYSDMAARNIEHAVERLMTRYLWREGEPETPSHFSSPGLSMD